MFEATIMKIDSRRGLVSWFIDVTCSFGSVVAGTSVKPSMMSVETMLAARRSGLRNDRMMRSRSLLGLFPAVTACLWCGLAVASTLPAAAAGSPSSATTDDGVVAAPRDLATGARLTTELEDLADVIGPSDRAPGLALEVPVTPEAPGVSRPSGVASSRSDGSLGKLVGPSFGAGDSTGAAWALSVGLRKDAMRRPALPGAGPEQELGLGAGVRVGLSEGVTLGGGYGYFPDDWSGYLGDDQSRAGSVDADDLGTDRTHHVAGLRLTFEFETSPALR
jgi:hypothetical protein